MRGDEYWLQRVLVASALALGSCAQLQPSPTAQVTSEGGPTIQEAQQESYDGPKARLAVVRFTDKTGKGAAAGGIGSGMTDMLATALFNTNRYIVLERETLSDVLAEQDIGASGRVRMETAAPVGQIEGAELLVTGAITEFEPGASGGGASAGASVGGSIGSATGSTAGTVFGAIIGAIAGSYQKSHLALDLRVVDAKTSRVVAATSVQGEATDIAGMGSLGGANLAGGLSGYAKTPMEKAVRIAIQEAVKFVVSKTPAQYYRYSAQEKVMVPAVLPPGLQPPLEAAPSPPPAPAAGTAEAAPPPASAALSQIVYVKGDSVNLRSGPGTNYKRVGLLGKGTKLSVAEAKNGWLRVRQDDGREGWIAETLVTAVDTTPSQAVPSAGPIPSSQQPAVGSKPLTNDDVISLAKAGLSEAAIIAAVKGSPKQFDLSAQSLIRLREAGVSNGIIEAMLVP